MIGNDIVDLSFVSKSTNWKRKGYLSKVLTDEEQQIILRSNDQNMMVWRFWSMKEAAYKAHVQINPVRFFNPKAMVCKIVSEAKGIVTILDLKYTTTSKCSKDFIYTTATQNDSLNMSSAIIKAKDQSYKYQSSFLKHKVLEYISKSQNKNLFHLSISKNKNGVPVVFEFAKQLPLKLSLTHCGSYLAFSVLDC